MKESRKWLTADFWRTFANAKTAQQSGKPQPAIEKSYPDDASLITLPDATTLSLEPIDLIQLISNRTSHRQFGNESLTLHELSYLLWSTQGVRSTHANRSFRTVPSAGCRHPLETYLVILNVANLEQGLYRYLPLTHQLLPLKTNIDYRSEISEASLGQSFVGQAAVVFVWTAIPYRTEWRYSDASSKLIALDAGHVCQNLYLASEAIGAGTCAIAAYDQTKADALLAVDGEEEFVLYLAPVGKLPS